MLIVYIAGRYHADRTEIVEQNILDAKRMAIALARENMGFYCPHLATSNFQHYTMEMEDSFYLNLHMTIMLKCDALLLLPNWEYSEGAKKERKLWQEFKGSRLIFSANSYSTVPHSLISWYKMGVPRRSREPQRK